MVERHWDGLSAAMERGEIDRKAVGGRAVCELLASQAATFHLCFATLAAVDTEAVLEVVEHAEASHTPLA